MDRRARRLAVVSADSLPHAKISLVWRFPSPSSCAHILQADRASSCRVLPPNCRAWQSRDLRACGGLRRRASAFRTSPFRRATMSFGVPAGARIANQELKVKSGQARFARPSAHRETAAGAARSSPDKPELAAAHQRRNRAQSLKADRYLARRHVGRGLRRALVGNMGQAKCRRLEAKIAIARCCGLPGPPRAVVDLARRRLCRGDQVGRRS